MSCYKSSFDKNITVDYSLITTHSKERTVIKDSIFLYGNKVRKETEENGSDFMEHRGFLNSTSQEILFLLTGCSNCIVSWFWSRQNEIKTPTTGRFDVTGYWFYQVD